MSKLEQIKNVSATVLKDFFAEDELSTNSIDDVDLEILSDALAQAIVKKVLNENKN